MNIKRFAIAAAVVSGMWVSSASALLITIDTGNAALSGFTGPYATATVTRLTNTSASVVFSALTNGGFQYRLGNGAVVSLNVNGTYTLGPVSESGAFDGLNHFSNNTPGNVSSFGSFNLSLNNTDGYGDSVTGVSFTLTGVGTAWLTDADVLVANANGAVAAVHSFACVPVCTSTSGAVATGFAAGSGGGTPPNETPEPGTLGLLSISLLALGTTVLRRRRRLDRRD